MRDLVIGVGVVLPDGTRAHSGGKVVKNVAGYDLGKLYCGSAGRLGTVERLALRLHPCPAAAETIGVGAERWGELHRSGLVPSAVDVVAGRMYVLFEGARRRWPSRRPRFGGDRVEPWDEVRELQAGLPRPHALGRRDARRSCARARASPTSRQAEPPAWSPLAERVLEALCSPS